MADTNKPDDAFGNAGRNPIPGRSFAARFVFLRWVNLWELAIGVFVFVVGAFGHNFDASVSEYAHRMNHSMITYEVALLWPGMLAYMATQAGDRGPLTNKMAQSIVSILALAFGIFCYIMALRQFMGDETAKAMLPQSLCVLVGRLYPRLGWGSAISVSNLLRVGTTTIVSMVWMAAVVLGMFGILKIGGMWDQPIPDWLYGITSGFYYMTLAFGLPLLERQVAADASHPKKH